jgi:hypothetical protein
MRIGWKSLICGATLIAAGYILRGQTPVRTTSLDPGGFRMNEARFETAVNGEKIEPLIPKEWKLAAVGPGERPGESVLLFEDRKGNIFAVVGVVVANRFTLRREVVRIARR